MKTLLLVLVLLPFSLGAQKWDAGLHAGYVRSLSKALDLRAELRGNFVQMNDRSGGVLGNRAELIQTQATLGLHYRF